MFDPVCKLLIETFPTDFATWLLGEPIRLTTLDPTELLLDPIRADTLMLLESTDKILYIEVQTQKDPTIPFRMLDYRVRGHRRYPTKQMKQVVIYLKETRSEWVYKTTFELENTHHQFEAIRLWEQPLDLFLDVPGLLPFAVLSNTNNREETLRQVATPLQDIPAKAGRNNLITSTFVLSGLVLNQELIEQVLMSDLLEESVTYQSIKEKGRQQGIQMGIQQGMQQGIYQGIQQGQRQALQKMVLRLLARKLGELPEEVSSRIHTLSFGQLESLSDLLLDFTSIVDLRTWLSAQTQEGTAK